MTNNTGPGESFSWDQRQPAEAVRCHALCCSPRWAAERGLASRCLRVAKGRAEGLELCAVHLAMVTRSKDVRRFDEYAEGPAP